MSGPGLIIVGSGPAGVAAAESFRADDRESPVRMLTAADPPYARPPLSKEFLRGHTDDIALRPPRHRRAPRYNAQGGARRSRCAQR